MSVLRWIGGMAVVAILAALGLWRASVSFSPGAPTRAVKPLRIASLTLATDEILSELVPPERIVCVTSLADDREISSVPNFYPAHIPRLRDTDAERILALNPDLVFVAPYNSADFLKVMERSGLPVYRNEALDGMDAIQSAIVGVGGRVGADDRAQDLVRRMRQRRQQLADRLLGISHRPRVLFWSAGFTAGTQTTIHDIIGEAGAVNVAAERKLAGSAEMSPEQVIAADPDHILLSQWAADARVGRIENHPLLRNLRAVREQHVIAIEARYLTSVSQFVVVAAERLAAQLHPDRFADEPPSRSTRIEGAP